MGVCFCCCFLLLLSLSPLALVHSSMLQKHYSFLEVNPIVWNYWVNPQQNVKLLEAQLYNCPDLGFTLGAINEFRALHDAQPLSWDDDLADAAKRHLYDTLACSQPEVPLPAKSIDPVVPDAYGIGYLGVDLKATFKCVNAMNSWYYTNGDVDYSFQSEDNNNTAELATLLWNSTERVGCGLQVCGDNWMNIYCFFDPQNGSFNDPKILKENMGQLQGQCPKVYLTAWNDTFQTVAQKHGMSPEAIICYNGQGSVTTFAPGEGFTVAIPCKDAPPQFADNRCPEVDKLAGLSEGYCPSVHYVVPGQEDVSEVARIANEAAHKIQTASTSAKNFTYTFDNVCSYNAVNNVTNGYDYCHTIPPLQGATSAMFLPCRETVIEASQGGFLPDAGMYECPDQEEFMYVLNQYRAKHDLLPLVWNDEFGQELGDYFDRHIELLCPDFGVNFNYNSTFEIEAPTIAGNMLVTYKLWGPAAMNTGCLPYASFFYGLLREIQYYYTTLGDEMAATLLQTGSALVHPVVFSNDASDIACRILVCDSRKSYVSCTFDTPLLGPVDNETGFPTLNDQSQWLSVFDNQNASCPSAYFPTAVDTLQSVADRFNVSVEALMCWNNQLPNPEEFRMWYAMPQPIGIPCTEDAEQWMDNCTALAKLEGSCNFTYSVQPGERINGVVNRFSTAERNFTAEQLCCYNNMDSTCDVNFLLKLRIPCVDDLPALEECVDKTVDVCRRPYVVQKDDTVVSLAKVAAIEVMSLCCYWGYADLLDCELPEPGVVVELPCFEDLDARGCEGIDTEGDTTSGAANNTLGLSPILSMAPTSIPPPAPPTDGGSSGLSAGSIVGVALGCSCAAVLVGVVAGMFIWKSNRGATTAKNSRRLETQLLQRRMSRRPSSTVDISNTMKAASSRTGFADPPLDSIFMSEYIASIASSLPAETTGGACDVARERSFVIEKDDIVFDYTPDGAMMKIGTGAFSTVYQGRLDGDPVAVKVMHHTVEHKDQVKALLREISTLCQCEHENIVGFYGAWFSGDDVMLVFELMDQGDLFHLLRGRSMQELQWRNRGHSVALSIAKGLAYMHSKRIIHCDLKSPNILLGKDSMPKIGDMGMSKYLTKEYVTKGRDVGSFAWAAPELLLNSRISEKVDVYSLGVIMWEIVTGELPQRGHLREPRVPEECSAEVAALIRACRATNDTDRPSAAEVRDRLRDMAPVDLAS